MGGRRGRVWTGPRLTPPEDGGRPLLPPVPAPPTALTAPRGPPLIRPSKLTQRLHLQSHPAKSPKAPAPTPKPYCSLLTHWAN